MIVKTFRPRITVDGRGTISSGMRGADNLPKKLDYFDVSDFPELKAFYGEKPTKLLLYFPTDDPLDFYESAFNAWGQNAAGVSVKKRCCDGERCTHKIPEKINGKNYTAGEESDCVCKDLDLKDKSHCRFDCYFKAYIGDPLQGRIHNPSCYMFTTHSQNSADAVLSEIKKLKDLNGGVLRNVPFLLTVKLATSSKQANRKFPIWALQAWGTMESIGKMSQSLAGLGIKTPLIEFQRKENGDEQGELI